MYPGANRGLVALLRELGLTDYEARAYLVLCQQNPLNGHQVARLGGIPSAKVYATLQRLVTRGLVAYRDARPATYVPLPVEEFLSQRRRRMEEVAAEIRRVLTTESTSAQAEALWYASGFDAVVGRAQELLDRARAEVLLSAWEPLVSILAPTLRTAASRGLKLATIYFDGEGPGVGFALRHVEVPSVKHRHGGQSFLVVDEAMALFVNHASAEEGWQGIWTANAAMARAIANYIRHDIYVNKIIHRFRSLITDAYGETLDLLLDVFGDRILQGAAS